MLDRELGARTYPPGSPFDPAAAAAGYQRLHPVLFFIIFMEPNNSLRRYSGSI